MRTMAEVLAEHGRWHYTNGAGTDIVCSACGEPVGNVIAHQADALMAAGFGPVKTIAELAAIERAGMVWALRDAAKEAEYELDLVDEPKENAPSSWLRARAATMDNPAEKLRKP